MWAAMEDQNSPYYYYEDVSSVPYYFVYHFNAHFNKGLNIIQHTYDFDGMDLVMEDYMFDYVLTAANRWANNGIDDFTLEINMGDHQSFSVDPAFFENADEWTFSGKGKAGQRLDMQCVCEESCPMFHVQSGSIVFHKKNFHPKGELHVVRDGFFIYDYMNFAENERSFYDPESFINSMKSQYYNLRLNFYDDNPVSTVPMWEEHKRILKNIPFAYRGYVFKNKDLQRYFESTDWYIPDPDYVSDMTVMSKGEKEWIQFWSK